MRTLSQRDLNRALLARQLLLERVRVSIPRAVERMGGLQAQYAPAMYIGLWSRLEGFERQALTRALERRAVIQATLMRATIHLVSRRDYWPFAVAIREPRRRWWERSHPNRPRDMSAAARRLRGFLADGPAAKTDLAEWAGIPVGELAATLERLKLRRFRDEGGKELLDLPRAPLADGEAPAPPRFLPVWDATLLVHARRTQILPEEYRPLVFNMKTPNSVNTFLLDGQVAGAWRYDGGKVKLEPFDGVARKWRRDLDDEARRLAAFHA